MSKFYDVIVVGSGIAGLSFALKVANAGHRVAIITKKDSAESNTNYAQGGIAAVTSATDDVEMHVADTLDAGDGLCDEQAVREILRDGPASINELVSRGSSFPSSTTGVFHWVKKAGTPNAAFYMFRMSRVRRSKRPCSTLRPPRRISTRLNIILPWNSSRARN